MDWELALSQFVALSGPLLYPKESTFVDSQVSAEKVAIQKKRSRWFWPVSLLATGAAGAAVVLFRGCWHRRMSWPIRVQDCSYQVCLSCGIKRLFDEQTFRAYGPYSYSLDRLMAARQSRRLESIPADAGSERRSAS